MIVTIWYLFSWIGLLGCNLITITYWPPLAAIGYFFASAMLLSWTHDYWWDNHTLQPKASKGGGTR